jgi:hypothetical protein
MGLGPSAAPDLVHGPENKKRIKQVNMGFDPVICCVRDQGTNQLGYVQIDEQCQVCVNMR